MDLDDVRTLAERLREQVHRVVIGHVEAVDLMTVALLSEGHVLLEGMPGTAKTLLGRTFAAVLSLDFKRIQFTPDLMPGDVIGTNLFHFQTNTFVLNKGPIFTQVLFADEINRTPPKTQAALLEAMQERSVTIDGESHDLGDGFFVIATQNPLENEGTYPLPEAQLDRFLVKIPVGYPDRDEERRMARLHGHTSSMPSLEDLGLERCADMTQIRAARRVIAGLQLSEEVLHYAVDIVRATRDHTAFLAGGSPRSTNMLCRAARARAALDGRDYVLPDDVKSLVPAVLGHRIVLAPGAELEGTSVPDVLQQILDQVPAPR